MVFEISSLSQDDTHGGERQRPEICNFELTTDPCRPELSKGMEMEMEMELLWGACSVDSDSSSPASGLSQLEREKSRGGHLAMPRW